jgi:transposase
VPAPYPLVFRQKVVDAYEAGHGSFKQVGEQFGIGEATVNRWVSKAGRGEDLTARVRAPRPPAIRGDALEYMLSLVADEPEWTTQDLADELLEGFGLNVSRQTVGATLRRAGFTRKRGSRVRQLPDPSE